MEAVTGWNRLLPFGCGWSASATWSCEVARPWKPLPAPLRLISFGFVARPRQSTMARHNARVLCYARSRSSWKRLRQGSQPTLLTIYEDALRMGSSIDLCCDTSAYCDASAASVEDSAMMPRARCWRKGVLKGERATFDLVEPASAPPSDVARVDGLGEHGEELCEDWVEGLWEALFLQGEV